MNITIDNRIFMRVAGSILILFGLCEIRILIDLFRQGVNLDSGFMFTLLLCGLCVAMTLGIFALKASQYVMKYDDSGIHRLKNGNVINSVYWDSFETAYFKSGYHGLFIVALSPRSLSVSERKHMDTAFIRANGIYLINFGNIATKKGAKKSRK